MAKTVKQSTSPKVWYAVAAARVTLGFVFLWAFVDQLFGLGYASPAARAWLHGASPTAGFLKGVHGPFAGTFHGMAGAGWADWLFMLGLLGLGLALLLGWGLRIAAVSGTLLLLMMWAASLPITTNPFVDEHLVYIPMLWVFAFAEPRLSCATYWRKLPYVRANPWLR